MLPFRSLNWRLSLGLAWTLMLLVVAVSPGAVAADGDPDHGVEDGLFLGLDGGVRVANAEAGTRAELKAPGGVAEAHAAPAPWDPRPALASLSRLLAEAIKGSDVTPGAGSGPWYRTLAPVVFESDAAVATDPQLLTDPDASAADGPDPLLQFLGSPLRGITEHLHSELVTGEGMSWRMHYGRPSELGRGRGWRHGGKGDALFDDDGSLEPAPAVGVQMKLDW
ncbi:MAG: hypothetical protein U5S82_23455 [Gammaproteobacteria bacterium]|nr:hypothetical protein [Gammaproteobacteria bacterium]